MKKHVSETGSVSVLKWGKTPTLLGPLERANLNHWTLREFIEPVVNRFMRQTLSTINRKHISLWISLVPSPSAHKNAQQNAALRQCTPQAQSPFWLLKLACEHAHARLLPRLSWSWTLLLLCDTENLLPTLQLFYFHSWPIYWLSLVQAVTQLMSS
jgi:hypothetical protein